MPVLLVIDDEASIRHAFGSVFREPEYTVVKAASAAEGLECLAQHHPDVIVLDVNLPDISGLEAFDRIRATDGRVQVVLMSGKGTTDTAIEAMKRGAFDYLVKPLELPQLRTVIAAAVRNSRFMRTPALVTDGAPSEAPSDALVGRCPAMQEVYKAIGRSAPQDVTVLIQGESGTGKELVARAIYQHSRRAGEPFLAINCAAIPETLLESELFGHEKGAFTGADRMRIGKFEQCSDGTLLLDEIGDMTPMTQAKVLRLLQEQRFERVGGNQTIQTRCRMIAATNRDLSAMVAEGKFRGDLYYRLGSVTIQLPPLRQRLEDLPLLVAHFLRRFNRDLDKDVQQVSPAAMEILTQYHWPGNVREFQGVLMHALLYTNGPVVMPESLPASLRKHPAGGEQASERPARDLSAIDWDAFVEEHTGSTNLHAEALEAVEKQLLTTVLRRSNGNQLQAAKLLGITRGSLRNKIRALGIAIDRVVWSSDDQDDPATSS
ncbi:MAG: sigma-54-dependent transcriptional regulator [Tepidisphaerales bacterium]